MIGFIDTFFYNHSLSVTITHIQSTANKSPSLTTAEHLNCTERSHVSSLYNFGKDRIDRSRHLQQFLYYVYYVLIRCCRNVFSDRLPGNGCPSMVESLSSRMYLPSRCLAMAICVTIFIDSNKTNIFVQYELRWLSRYSDGLLDGRPGFYFR
jgi:hypothetical protein